MTRISEKKMGVVSKFGVNSSIFIVRGILAAIDVLIVYLFEPLISVGDKIVGAVLSRDSLSKPHVVILGSSFAGLAVRSALGSRFKITLVDRKV